MFATLRSILSRMDVDYSDIRYETMLETVITFNGRELTQVSSNSTDGYVVRAQQKGGFSSVAFTREKDWEWAIRKVQENAFLLARCIREPVKLARADVCETLLPRPSRRTRALCKWMRRSS